MIEFIVVLLLVVQNSLLNFAVQPAESHTPELQVVALSSSLSTGEMILTLQAPVGKNMAPARMTLKSAWEQSRGLSYMIANVWSSM